MNSVSKKAFWRNVLLVFSSLFVCACLTVSAFFIGRQSARMAAPAPATDQVAETAALSSSPSPQPSPTASPAPTEDLPGAIPEIQDSLDTTRTPMPPLSREFDLQREDLELLLEVWEIIAREYDGEIPPNAQLLHSAITGSLEVLDDEFTRFIAPEAAARMREDLQGAFEGIGAFIRMTEEGLLQIVRPIAGQPAARAGIQANDIILSVDGVTIQGMTIDEAISRVRGPRDTPVTLTISREGLPEPFDVTIVRERIEIPTVEAEILPDGIAYVRLSNFNSRAAALLQEAITELMGQNPQALVFDLRDNPGGFLDQAVGVADLFLPEGVVLYERNLRGLDEVFRSQDGGPAEDVPLAVLVNAGSASAAEIVAGAIKDRGRAILIGESTFGKGSVQQAHSLSDGSELRVTIARWYTPADNSIDEIGIAPDIEVLPSPLEFGGPDDSQLQRAIEYLLTDR